MSDLTVAKACFPCGLHCPVICACEWAFCVCWKLSAAVQWILIAIRLLWSPFLTDSAACMLPHHSITAKKKNYLKTSMIPVYTRHACLGWLAEVLGWGDVKCNAWAASRPSPSWSLLLYCCVFTLAAKITALQTRLLQATCKWGKTGSSW